MVFKGIYWLYFEYYVYMRVAEGRVLLLNTLDNQKILSDHPLIVRLFEKIRDRQDEGGFEIDFDTQYREEIYQSFFNKVRNKYMGDLIRKDLVSAYPFQFPFMAKINDEMKEDSTLYYWNYDFLKNCLFTLDLFLNNACEADCKDCTHYYKQFCCCSKYVEGHSLSPASIDKILDGPVFDNLNKVNISGGNVSLYEHWDYLLEKLSRYKEKCFVYYHYTNIRSIDEKVIAFFEDRIGVLIDVKSLGNRLLKEVESLKNKFSVSFIVRDESDLRRANRAVATLDGLSYELIPFFDGDNLAFFQQYVFVNEKDILANPQTIKQIHRNQKVNNFFFGGLVVFPNGDVKSATNGPVLGNLEHESVLQLISKELKNPEALWLKTRNKTSCKTCLYCDLCPSVSNYDEVMNQCKVCTMK